MNKEVFVFQSCGIHKSAYCGCDMGLYLSTSFKQVGYTENDKRVFWQYCTSCKQVLKKKKKEEI